MTNPILDAGGISDGTLSYIIEYDYVQRCIVLSMQRGIGEISVLTELELNLLYSHMRAAMSDGYVIATTLRRFSERTKKPQVPPQRVPS